MTITDLAPTTADPVWTATEHPQTSPGQPDHNAEITRLAAENSQLRAQLNTSTHNHEIFKKLVARVGERAARENSFCSVYDDVMDQLGLQRPPTTFTGTIELTVEFTATLEDLDYLDGDIESLIRGSVQLSTIEDSALLDDDWSDTSFTVRTGEVTVTSRTT